MPRRLAAFESLDNDHATTAVRTGMCAGRLFIGGVGRGMAGLILASRIEQHSRPRDVLDTLGAGEQAVVADAVEAVRQDVDEEAPDELVRAERHDLLARAAVGAVVLVPEGDALL